MPTTGPNNSSIARIAASWPDMPRSIYFDTPSTITIASSTTMPIASTMPKRVDKFTEKPSAAMPAKAPMMVTGTVVAGTSVARKFCKKTRITMRTSTPACHKVV